MRASISSDLFGNEARALGPLLTNLPLLKEALGLVAKETQYAGSANKEYEVRSKTFANSLQLFRNRLTAMGIRIGNALLPALNSLMEVLGPIVEVIADLADRFPGLTRVIVAVVAGLIAFRVAAIAASFAGLQLKSALLGTATAALWTGGKLKAAAAIGFMPFRAAAVRLVGVLQTVALRFRLAAAAGMGFNRAFVAGTLATFGRALLTLLNPIGLVRAAMIALRFAVIGTGIGAILVAIAMAGAWIYNNWQGIKVAFEAFKGAFMRAIAQVLPTLQLVIDGVSTLFGWISDLTGPLDAGTWAAWGMAAGAAVGNVVVWMAELPGKIAAALSPTALLEAGSNLIAGLWEGMKAKMGEVLAGVSAFVGQMTSLFSFSGPAAPGASAGPVKMSRAGPVPQRARGGRVQAGQLYQVNDDGSNDPVELFRPGKSGTILPSSERRKLAGSGGSPVTVNQSVSFTISGAQDVRSIVEEVKRALAQESERVKRAAFADFGMRTV